MSGTMVGGEEWSTGFWMSGTGVSSEETAAALALIITGTLNATDSSGAMQISASLLWTPDIKWTKTTVYAYTSGGTIASFVGEYILPSPRAGGLGVKGPNQVALVLSLRTGFPGRRNRGRMYLPACALSLSGDGEASQSDLDTLTTAWQTGFNDINASDTGKIVVVSAAAGAFHQVSSVSMDSRMDIQRRRAKQQSISRTSVRTVTL